jgi:hypothetical protein
VLPLNDGLNVPEDKVREDSELSPTRAEEEVVPLAVTYPDLVTVTVTVADCPDVNPLTVNG